MNPALEAFDHRKSESLGDRGINRKRTLGVRARNDFIGGRSFVVNGATCGLRRADTRERRATSFRVHMADDAKLKFHAARPQAFARLEQCQMIFPPFERADAQHDWRRRPEGLVT